MKNIYDKSLVKTKQNRNVNEGRKMKTETKNENRSQLTKTKREIKKKN